MIILAPEEAQQVLDALEGSIDAQEWEINDHITKYGEWYRPQRVEYMKQQLANTNSMIATLRAKMHEYPKNQVRPHEFLKAVEGKEEFVGMPIIWAEWPTKEISNG
jgi:hypothetical protein